MNIGIDAGFTEVVVGAGAVGVVLAQRAGIGIVQVKPAPLAFGNRLVGALPV